MVDPIVSTLVAKAVELAQNKLSEAKQFTVQNVQRCQSYLEAARAAINGLEAEYDAILVEAKWCDPNQVEEMKDLYRRIDAYLYGEHLRPLLRQSIDGLQACHAALQANADQFLPWPWRRPDRQKAVAGFTDLLQALLLYFYKLDNDLSGPSGVNVPSLQLIQQHLELQLGADVPVRSFTSTLYPMFTDVLPDLFKEYSDRGLTDQTSQKAQFLFDFVRERQQNRSRAQLMGLIGDIQRTIEELRLEFTRPWPF